MHMENLANGKYSVSNGAAVANGSNQNTENAGGDSTKFQNGVTQNGVDTNLENSKKMNGNHQKQNAQNHWSEAASEAIQQAAPLQTFYKAPFNELMGNLEGVGSKVQPTLELTQAMLMTTNFKEASANVNTMQNIIPQNSVVQTSSTSNGHVAGVNGNDRVGTTPEGVSTGGNYFFKQDYMSDLTKKCASKDFSQVSKLCTNIGTSDKATNWLLEQRTLQRAEATEGREIRELIDNKIVDQLEYIRIKENIAQTKIRTKDLTADNRFSDDVKPDAKENGSLSENDSSETEEDSGQALKNKLLSDRRINRVIKSIRKNAKQYLQHKDGLNYDNASLTAICKKLRKDPNFVKRRDQKYDFKAQECSGLKEELKTLLSQKKSSMDKKDIYSKIQAIESVLGLEKRLRTDNADHTIAEIDMKPMDANAFDIQNVLFDYCKVNVNNQYLDESQDCFANQKRVERLFGKIRKLPKKSCLLSNFESELYNHKVKAPKKQAQELVKVIGLEPEKLFEKIPKYKIQIAKMPRFSNTFDSVDSVIPGMNAKNSIAGQSIINPMTSHMNFQRIDGRQVISLQFNPYFISDDTEKKKIYNNYMKEIIEQRDKIKNAPKEAKNKQESQNIKRAWLNIVKKDIPKAFRMYQKFKADQESNNKKLSQNCLKEVRKRAVKTQRLAKESVMRARRLTKEMCNYWRKRDKEQADSKRKREKQDKEQKKRQQEEEEAMLQKKRLEYLMSQSEIYAHFMAAKLGVVDEQKSKSSEMNMEKNHELYKKVNIDRRAARINVKEMINENYKRLDEFDEHDREEVNDDDLEEENVDKMKLKQKVQKPDMFKGDLKAYQLKGLQWLDNLYDQGINGILADEMGLGKTIQTIALLAHLAEKKDVWGPFLIIVPVTTLHNWQNELQFFCPSLKVLPYFGNAEERKRLAKYLDPRHLYNSSMGIHVIITSYNLIVGGGKDQLRLQRVKWHYMILDEAQAIKNNQSRRWKTLLNFNTRNRLLLSGTPIQNSMAELWALLHFIMPKLFDNHEQFQEWFSKDIEQHSMDQGELNKHQLKRLHLILQPFMLRRLKIDVEQEIAPKEEAIIQCIMTHRQKVLYDRIKNKIKVADLFHLAANKNKMENLMNLVMQFRKVCNHPDLFETRQGKIPFCFSKMQPGMLQNMSLVSTPTVMMSNSSPICFNLPKMVYDECFLISDNNSNLFSKQRKNVDVSLSSVSVETHFSLFNIFNEKNLHEQIYCQPKEAKTDWISGLSVIGLLARSNNWSMGDISYLAVSDPLIQQISLIHYYSQRYHKNTYLNIHNSEKDSIKIDFGGVSMAYSDGTGLKTRTSGIDVMVSSQVYRDESNQIYKPHVIENLDLSISGDWVYLKPLVPEHPREFLVYDYKNMQQIYFEKCVAHTIDFYCPSLSFKRFIRSVNHNPVAKKVMIGDDFKPRFDHYIGRIGRDRSAFVDLDGKKLVKNNQIRSHGRELIQNGVLSTNYLVKGPCTFQLPDYSRLVTDCSKMKILQDLLVKKHAGKHRCLVFCQMTKMMDILEDFLIWKKYSYFRMDGSTQLQDRRFMVEEFQTNPNVFVFILSTRAGGLGINLIAADTVIFYDNDWNPTMDSQATDRAHRIGQTKKVHVYRLVTKSSVEERILRRAKQKQNVQSTVYGANLKADSFSARDVVDMLVDDDDPLATVGQNRNQVKGFIKTGTASKEKAGRKKKKKKVDDGDNEQLYETVAKIDKHKKYENEIDQLLGGNNEFKVETKVQQPAQDQYMSSSDEEVAPQQQTREVLLKMLEKTGGNTRTIFNYEEEDAVPLGMPNPNAPGGVGPNGQVAGAPQRNQRGRPAKNAVQNQMEGDEEDIMDEEDPDY